MKKALLYYSFGFSFGGGEALPLSFVEALQNTCQLTVALDVETNLARAAELSGCGIDFGKLRTVQVTPQGYDISRHGARDSLYRFRRLRELAKDADVCISTGNVMDFGRSAHHFINMLAFGDDGFTAYAKGRVFGTARRTEGRAKRIVSDCILRPVLGMRSKGCIIRNAHERIYPNSRFVEGLMRDYYGPFNGEVFLPPTLFEPTDAGNAARDPLKVVYIGRIVPEKRVAEIVGIVERARAATGLDVRMSVAGRLDQDPSYGERLGKMAETRAWLEFVGPKYGKDKERFLLSGSYAIHAERFEAFGISIAEYLKSGAIAIVPDAGGSQEVVDSAELTYHTDDDASGILSRLLSDSAFRARQREHCARRATFFSREAYLKRQQRLLERIVST